MAEALNQASEVDPWAASDYAALQNEVSFNPEQASKLQQKDRLVQGYIARLKEDGGDEETIKYFGKIAESVSDILLDPESLKEFRTKRIEELDGKDIGISQEKNKEYTEYLVLKGMDIDFWHSSEYLGYCKEKMPEIYTPNLEQVARDMTPFLEKTGDEINHYLLECYAKEIENGNVAEGISRTIKFFSSQFMFNLPKDRQIGLKFLEDVEPGKVPDNGTAFYEGNDKNIYLNRPLEYYKSAPIGTIALIAHEVFHACQHYIAEQEEGNPKSDQYRQNFKNYINIDTDPESYARQLVEAEAWILEIGILRQFNQFQPGAIT